MENFKPEIEPNVHIPAPVDRPVLDAMKKAEENFDPMMAPAGLAGLYLPKLLNIINGLSNKSLRRVLGALVAWPMEPLTPNKNNEAEVTAYTIADRILQAKYVMVLYLAHEAEEKRKQEAKELGLVSSEEQLKQQLNTIVEQAVETKES